MADQSRRARLAAQARAQAPRVQIEQWHSISVVRYANGDAKAWHNRLDLGTRKLISESLADPVDPTADIPWYVLALTNAAEEVEVAHRLTLGLW